MPVIKFPKVSRVKELVHFKHRSAFNSRIIVELFANNRFYNYIATGRC